VKYNKEKCTKHIGIVKLYYYNRHKVNTLLGADFQCIQAVTDWKRTTIKTQHTKARPQINRGLAFAWGIS
jgi:hypothetical protein